jgi:hypothetical protein
MVVGALDKTLAGSNATRRACVEISTTLLAVTGGNVVPELQIQSAGANVRFLGTERKSRHAGVESGSSEKPSRSNAPH